MKATSLLIDARWEAGVVFALAIADGIVRRLSLRNSDVAVLDDCWSWIEYRAVRASHIYDHIEAVSTMAAGAASPDLRNGFCAIGTVLYYVAWHAFRDEHSAGRVAEEDIPNDMSDVTEDALLEILDYTRNCVPDAEALISSVTGKLSQMGMLENDHHSIRVDRAAFAEV